MSDENNSVAQSWFKCGMDICVILGCTAIVIFMISLLLAKVSLFGTAVLLLALFVIGFTGWAADWKVQNVLAGVHQLADLAVCKMGKSFTKIMISIATLCTIAGIVWGFTR